MYLKREAYGQLLEWKNRPGHSALEVSGARQAGKTYLVNRFADEQSDFIVTGSYLGKILNKEFKYSAGDLDFLEIGTLGFEEFLEAAGRESIYEGMSLYGESSRETYQELQALYQDYCRIGGYPGVVLKYIEKASLQDCQAELLKIIRLFSHES